MISEVLDRKITLKNMKDAPTSEVPDKTCQVSYPNCKLGFNGAIFYENMKCFL